MYKRHAEKYVTNGVHVATARPHIKYKTSLPAGMHTEVSKVDGDICTYVINVRVETNQLFLLSCH